MKRITSNNFCLASLVAAGFACSASIASAECVPAHKFKTIEPGVLTVSTTIYPPFDIPQNDGGFTGVEGDILQKIADRECLKLKAESVSFSAAIQYVTVGRADVSAGQWYRTAERLKAVGLTDGINLDQLGIYSKEGYTKLSQLEGKQVGTVQGYNWVPDLQKVYGDNLKLYPTPVALAQDLSTGRVDVGLDSAALGLYEQQKKGGFKGFQIRMGEPDPRVRASINPAQVGFAYTKDNAALGVALNEDIAELHKAKVIPQIMQSYGLDPKSADVGAPRLVQ
ncbi:substrate-binding periplasmic protein [Paraburkholderia oxyphila]|uniref:substrate-binding periplasmic protein n=1 Tax=Paraburkholderia oxyphila TaxID=614212 RepID=UPI000480F6D8|nr:transporter substrate-binding domain-containing protein [Paraburkholderia oxyphila]